MPSPIPTAIRKLIIQARNNGMPIPDIVKNFNAKTSTVYKLLKKLRETGSCEPRPNNAGAKPRLSPQQLDSIRQAVEDIPDITLQELKDKLNLSIGISTLWEILTNKLKLRRKKNSSSKRPTAR